MICKLTFLLFAIIASSYSHLITLQQKSVTLYLNLTEKGLMLELNDDGVPKLSAQLGVGLNTTTITNCRGVTNCLVFEKNIRLHVTLSTDTGYQILWKTNDTSKVLKDCYSLDSGVNWFGGPEHFYQAWPVEKLNFTNNPYVTKEENFQAIAEPYWLNSLGAYIFVNRKTPLFIDQNSERSNNLCLIARASNPYLNRTKVSLQYTIATQNDAKLGHLHAVHNFLGKPKGHPNYKMIQRPVWSTWARYKRDVNDSSVLEFATEIVQNGYRDGQFELDDDWEECYGALIFSAKKFSNITNTVKELKQMGFRVTLWIHPFVNINCEPHSFNGLQNNFFVKDENGSSLTEWWNSNTGSAHYLDFTDSEVRDLFEEKLKLLQIMIGIDSFKFDAGESSWTPKLPVLNGDIDLYPNVITEDYVRTCARFGDLIEVRSGVGTQDLPVFVRMIDKDSTWGINNGLYTLITTLLQMNFNGYTMVLPDMVGGNGYYGRPTAELFVRWLQANTFMPSIQFSFVPWDYNDFKEFNVSVISKKFVDLHDSYADEIVKVMNRSINYGYPVNAPVWWVDPTNKEALKVDTEYMLGEDIVVAPVIEEGATSRDVFLPAGVWIDGNNGTVYQGNQTLRNYNAPIDVLPYFIRDR